MTNILNNASRLMNMEINSESKSRILIYQKLLIFLLPLILYANTLKNDYALDDSIVITQNKFTKKGLTGVKDILSNDTFTGFFGTKKNLVAGGRYRPLSQISFALEYQFFELNPKISHFINFLLYAFTGLLIFIVFRRLLPKEKKKIRFLSIPFITAILFIVHPVHTEVIANIKGRDEIFSFIFSLLSLLYVLTFLDKSKMRYLFYSALCFFLGLLSKENTAMFLPVIFVAVLLFTNHSIKRNFLSMIPLIFSFSLFVFIRYRVLGAMLSAPSHELMNEPFLNAVNGEKFSTIFYTLGQYIRLLFYPNPLTYDYYPFHIHYVKWDNINVLWPLVLYSIMILYSSILILINIFKKEVSQKIKRQNIIVFTSFYYLVTLFIVSNIIFSVGTFMNERFLYMPSLGFSIFISWVIVEKVPKYFRLKTQLIPVVVIILLLIPSSIKTITRNKAWKNDFILFTTDVKVSSNSAKSNCSAGGKYLEKAQATTNDKARSEYFDKSVNYLKKSIDIYPTYIDALLLMGNVLYEKSSNYNDIAFYYSKVLQRSPKHPQIIKNSIIMLNGFDSIDNKISFLKELYQYNTNVFEWNYNLGMLYGRGKGDISQALKYLEKAAIINPNDERVHKDLGVAFGFLHEYQQSIVELKKAAEIMPTDLQIYNNIAVSYLNLGMKDKAQEYMLKAESKK